MSYTLKDLLDIEKLQEVMDSLHEITSIGSTIMDCDGNILASSGWCDLCVKYHRVHPSTALRCQDSDKYIFSHVQEAQPSVTYKCLQGLYDSATPLFINGKHLGNVFIGQLFLEPPDLDFFRRQAKEFGFPEEEYMQAVAAIPVITRDQLEKRLKFIRAFTEIIGGMGLKRLKELEKERQLNEAQRIAHLGSWEYDVAHGNFSFSEEANHIFGAGEGKVRATFKEFVDMVHPEDREQASAPYLNPVAGDEYFEREYRCVRKNDGQLRHLFSRGNFVKGDSGQCVRIVGIVQDITERKLAENAVKNSREKYQRLLDTMREGFARVDPSGLILECNDAFQEMLGYTREELCTFHYQDITVERWRPVEEKIIQEQVYARGYSDIYIKEYVRKDGTLIPVELRTMMFNDDAGKPYGMWAIVRDVSERVRLEQTQRQLVAILGATPDIVAFCNVKTRQLKYMNKAGRRLCGFGEEEDISRVSIPDLHPVWANKMHEELIFPAAVRDGIWEGECAFMDRQGKEIPVSMVTLCFKDAHGEPEIFATISRDITEGKRAEEALRQAEQRFRDIVYSSSDWIWEVDLQGRYTFASGNVKAILGYEPEELIGKTPFDLMPPDEAERLRKEFAEIVAGKRAIKDLDNVNISKDGRRLYFLTNGVPILDKDGVLTGYRGVDKDITMRKLAEFDLVNAKDYLDKLINSISDPIFVKDREHKLVLVNDAECRLAGRTREEMLGKTDYAFFPKEQVDVFWKKDEQVFSTGTENINEEAITDPAGEVHTIITKKTLYTDKTGNKFIVGIIRDISTRRRAEAELELAYMKLQETQKQLIQSAKMAAMGQLVAGVSHELNQPLTGIKGFAQTALTSLQEKDPDATVEHDLQKIVEQSDRMSRIIKNLRLFIRKSEYTAEQLNLNRPILDSLELVGQQLKVHNIHVTTSLSPDLPEIIGDPTQFQQVFLNFLTNARDAIDSRKPLQGGEIRITTEYVPKHKAIEITFKDTGCGIPAQNLEHVFNPFFTTKSPDGGMGLGLSIAYGIVEGYHGRIDVVSEVGKGTEFKIIIPVEKINK